MLQRLCDEMEAIHKATEGLVAMDDALKGEGGNAIRSFYEECHLPFTLYFDATNREFIDKLRSMGNALDALEPHPEGYIKEEFLEGAVEEGLEEIANLTESLKDEANSIMDQVADIVALPHLDDSDVQEGVNRAKVRRDETITQLGAFDAEQTNALISVETNLSTMETWLTDLESLFKEGLTDVDFPAEKWGEYAEKGPLKKALETDSTDVEGGINTKKTPQEIMGDISRNLNHGIPGAQSSFAMFMAKQNDGLSIKKEKDGTYRVNATETALNRLQVK